MVSKALPYSRNSVFINVTSSHMLSLGSYSATSIGIVPRSSPGGTRNTQGMSGVGEEEDTHRHRRCVEEVAFFYF